VFQSYRRFALPSNAEWIEQEALSGQFETAMKQVPPSVLFAMAQDPALKDVSRDVASHEIAELVALKRPDLNSDAISRAFGTPKPTLTHSRQLALLNLRTFPALMGYSSRILAESWESNNLYYAALADQAGVPVDQLDAYVPEWNRSAIENIFATHLEDWPALLQSLNTLGDSVIQHTRHSERPAGAVN
jgi:hypothetical protein